MGREGKGATAGVGGGEGTQIEEADEMGEQAGGMVVREFGVESEEIRMLLVQGSREERGLASGGAVG
jgi:hypothetical protein